LRAKRGSYAATALHWYPGNLRERATRRTRALRKRLLREESR
jgi:hypothetical protein